MIEDQTDEAFVADQPDYFHYVIEEVQISIIVIAPLAVDLDSS
ncbi:hypothetical protein [Gracilibacillus salitolerans]|nr:hypothetical protein [Gracilibacillus salitolerans]